MKNLKVSAKLILSFSIAIALTAAVGIVGIVGMMQINTSASDMYEYNTEPMPQMAKVIENLQRIRVNVREYALTVADTRLTEAEKNASIEETRALINSFVGEITANLDLFEQTIRRDEVWDLYNAARPRLNAEYAPHLGRVYQYALDDDITAILDELVESRVLTNEIVEAFEACMIIKVDDAAIANEDSDALFTSLLIVIIVVLIISVIVSLVLALYISNMFTGILTPLAGFLKRAGTEGDISVSSTDKQAIDKYINNRDELGAMTQGAFALVGRLTDVSDNLNLLAGGDLTAELAVLSDRDVIGNSLKKMTDNLNEMFGEVKSSTEQVSTGAKQIADGSQTLAQGSTEQASSVQELSSSMTEIAGKTKENAQMASKAADLSETIRGNAEKGSRQMDEMMTAVKDINDASQSISKVIKTIDDIAFQTNILALNAAVEAARAGQHGKGFAVVAEEVRSLAAKSSDAAKDTSELIANSMEKAELGSRIADETAKSLTEIVTGINESSKLIGEIAHSSEDQSVGIEQVNRGIDQVAQVVQQNSATAEQSAAAAQEMSGQSDMLQGLVEQFKLRGSGSSSFGRSLPGRAAPAAAPKPVDTYQDNDGSFGKY